MESQLTNIEKQTLNCIEQAKNFVIVDTNSRLLAIEKVKGIKALNREIRAVFDPIINTAYLSHKKAVEQRDKLLDPLGVAEQIYKLKAIAYDTEQEHIRREEELRLQEAARKAEEERMLREAEAYEAQGLSAEAEEIISAPVEPPPVMVPSYQPKVEGESTRVTWDFEIVNEDKIVQQFMIPDIAAIRKVVTGLGKTAEAIVGGIRVFEKKVMAIKI